MIEFLGGALLGAIAMLVRLPSVVMRYDELAAENKALRAGLHHVAGVLRHRPELPSLVRYIDRLLDDEAGA